MSTLSQGALSTPGGFTFGQLDDADFGRATHSVHFTPRLPRNSASGLPIVPPFATNTAIRLDSVVALIPIDSSRGFYGPGRSFPIAVRQIDAPVDFTRNYYSNELLPTRAENIAAEDILQPSLERVEVRDTSINGRSFRRAHLRLKLSEDFTRRFDALGEGAFAADSTFRDNFAGIYLTPNDDTDALLSLLPAGLSQDTAYAGFNFYYQDTSGRTREYRIGFLQALPNYEHDFSGSLVDDLIDGPTDTSLVALVGSERCDGGDPAD